MSLINYFSCHELFEINDNAIVTYNNQQRVIYIDNFFRNFNQITELTQHVMADKWKGVSPNSRNFIDYYDCRVTYGYTCRDDNRQVNYNKLFDLAEHHFNLTVDRDSFLTQVYDLQFFKHNVKQIETDKNFFPHIDTNRLNLLVYIDHLCSGGTAFYKKVNQYSDHDNEDINAIVDVTNNELQFVTKSVPNRAVLFDGNRPHGGYIDNHEVYFNEWRKSLVMFFPFQYRT